MGLKLGVSTEGRKRDEGFRQLAAEGDVWV